MKKTQKQCLYTALLTAIIVISGCAEDYNHLLQDTSVITKIKQNNTDNTQKTTIRSEITSTLLQHPTNTLQNTNQPQLTPTTLTNTQTNTNQEYNQPTQSGCQCLQWTCQTIPTTIQGTGISSLRSSTTTTTTTCITIPDTNYTPQEKQINLEIQGNHFTPDNIQAHPGDNLTITITNQKGLHKITNTQTNTTTTLQPGTNTTIKFQAQKTGTYQLTCNPYCEKTLEANVTITPPTKQLC